jgi:uncharacterized ion transporter superfamily protein YfcC
VVAGTSAAFTVVDRTGALATGVSWLVARLGHRRLLVIPIVSLFFAAGGVLETMQESSWPLTGIWIYAASDLETA